MHCRQIHTHLRRTRLKGARKQQAAEGCGAGALRWVLGPQHLNETFHILRHSIATTTTKIQITQVGPASSGHQVDHLVKVAARVKRTV